jgi:EXLDI family protein
MSFTTHLTDIYNVRIHINMPTKTIYVSEEDAPVFEKAKDVAGEAVSSVIVRALREFLARHEQKERGMKEVSIRVGSNGSQREQRFNGALVSEWHGISDNKEWWLESRIFRTQKGNWAVVLTQVCKASLLTNKREWKASGDYLTNSSRTDLLVTAKPQELTGKLPTSLHQLLTELAERNEKPVEFLDI